MANNHANGEDLPSKVGVNPVLNNFYKSEGKSVTTIESISEEDRSE